jgi:hypothetical protein
VVEPMVGSVCTIAQTVKYPSPKLSNRLMAARG